MPFLREARWKGAERIVEVPVRIVGRKQQAVPTDPFHGVEEVLAVVRPEPDVQEETHD